MIGATRLAKPRDGTIRRVWRSIAVRSLLSGIVVCLLLVLGAAAAHAASPAGKPQVAAPAAASRAHKKCDPDRRGDASSHNHRGSLGQSNGGGDDKAGDAGCPRVQPPPSPSPSQSPPTSVRPPTTTTGRPATGQAVLAARLAATGQAVLAARLAATGGGFPIIPAGLGLIAAGAAILLAPRRRHPGRSRG